MDFPYGLDEDAAFMTTWLELHKLEGIKKLAELSKNFKKPLQQKIKLQDIQSKTTINLQKTSLLINGPGLFDYLYEETKKYQFLECSFKNCIDSIYIMPLAEKLSTKIGSINACWLDENNKNIGINVTKNKILMGEVEDYFHILDGQVFLQFFNNAKHKKNLNKNLKLKNIINEINSTKKQQYLEESLKPNPIDWDIISNLAKRTFVPASEESRNRGAGGGDAND